MNKKCMSCVNDCKSTGLWRFCPRYNSGKAIVTKKETGMTNDPWKYRSEGMKCKTCMWYVPKESAALGRCRRHSPSMNGYPVVYPADWCGDHKLDETKVQGDCNVNKGNKVLCNTV